MRGWQLQHGWRRCLHTLYTRVDESCMHRLIVMRRGICAAERCVHAVRRRLVLRHCRQLDVQEVCRRQVLYACRVAVLGLCTRLIQRDSGLGSLPIMRPEHVLSCRWSHSMSRLRSWHLQHSRLQLLHGMRRGRHQSGVHGIRLMPGRLGIAERRVRAMSCGLIISYHRQHGVQCMRDRHVRTHPGLLSLHQLWTWSFQRSSRLLGLPTMSIEHILGV